MSDTTPSVVLRDERSGLNRRHLEASIDATGDLHIDGHDLGPATSAVSGDGEYEWFQVIVAADVPAVVALLDGHAGADVLAVLRHWTGPRSYQLEQRLRDGAIPIQRSTWSG